MRILYVSGAYVPSRRASSMQVMRMCAALAGLGHEVTLVSKGCVARQEAEVADEFAFYGVPATFALEKIPRPQARGGGLRYLWGISRLSSGRREVDLHYCRDPLAAWLLARRDRPVLWEAHGLPAGRWSLRVWRQLAAAPAMRRLVVISDALRRRFEELGLTPHHGDTVVAHDAAQPLETDTPPPLGRRPPRLGYVGHLYPGRGVELLCGLAERLPGCEIHIVGGSAADLARWRSSPRPRNFRLHGFLPPARLAETYGGFDILLMPYQARVGVAGGSSDTSAWMSPMKLFEYMAAGRPIIASDLPVLREILVDGSNSLLVPAQEISAWERAVQRLLGDEALRRRLSERARAEQRELHTWDARARAVLEDLPSGRP
jgi:glycosyltransferase involved in cell wall biosynthesis